LAQERADHVKTFAWWFLTGAAMTLAVLMIQGGVQDLISGDKSAMNFVLTVTGGGLLAGCIALIMNRIR
jgi:glucose-6-phosphate-specific signal transduction histidine kinase